MFVVCSMWHCVPNLYKYADSMVDFGVWCTHGLVWQPEVLSSIPSQDASILIFGLQ